MKIKKLICVILVVTACLACAIPAAALKTDGGPLTQHGAVRVEKGQTIEYRIELKSTEMVAAFRTRIYYDHTALALDSDYGTQGIELPNFSGSVTINAEDIVQLDRAAVVAVGDKDGSDFKENKPLVIVKFKALTTGTTELGYGVKEMRSVAEEVNLFDSITGLPQSNSVKINHRVFADSVEIPIISGTENATIPQPTTKPEDIHRIGIYGDVNGDERIDITDVLKMSKHIAKLITLEETQLFLGDVDKLGGVDLTDMLMLQRYVAMFPATPVGEDAYR